MKNLILFCFYLLSLNVFSQMNINAGDDTTICVTWNIPGSLVLGGNPTVSGGTDPYSYTWECNYNYVVGPNTYLLTASDFLDDTTVANPDLIHTVNSPVTFVLKIQDGLGQLVSDTIVVSFSLFGTNLLEYDYHILLGDSIQYTFDPNVWGGTPPLTYLWSPSHGLTDSTSYNHFWVKPTMNTSYSVTITDAVGCVVSGAAAFNVYVGYVNQSELGKENTLLYPNPTDGRLILNNNDEKIESIVIYEQNGKILQRYNEKNCKEIDISEFENGIYQVVLYASNRIITKQVIKGK